MIPLRLKARVEDDGRPFFVAKLTSTVSGPDHSGIDAQMFEECQATLVAELENELVFQTSQGYLRIAGASISDIDNDVLFVDTHRSMAHRWIRAQSSHNTLVITERCDQLCIMCSQPPKKYHVDLFEYFVKAACLAPFNTLIGISGGEPTLYKGQLFELVTTVLRRRPDLRFHILTNAQHFTSDDLSVLRDPVFQRVCWGVPIYAPNAAMHDEIVKKTGAFNTLLQAFTYLLRAAAPVEIRTVIVKPNLPLLPDLARFVSKHLSFAHTWALMQLENIGFGRMRWQELFVDHSIEFAPIADAIDIATAYGMNTQLYNFPLCTVPLPYRTIAGQTISDWKQKYLAVCSPCTVQSQCAGFFEWHPENLGFREMHPL